MADIDQEKRDKKYNQWARYYPAIVNLVFPLIVIVYAFFDKIHVPSNLTLTVSRIELITKIILVFGSVIPALFFFYVFFIRELSMHVVERFLDALLGKKTINMLEAKNQTFSDDRKKAIKDKIKSDFKIEIPAEGSNRWLFPKKTDFRIKAGEACDCIRENTRQSAILFEYNCVYGFFRNLSGGLLFNLLVLFIIHLLKVRFDIHLQEIISCYWYIIPIMLLICLIFIRTSDYTYSKRLYVVFLNQKKQPEV